MAVRKNAELKQIQIDELAKPCKVLKKFYEKAHCSSYLVSITVPDGWEEPRFLQVFPSRQDDLCRRTEEKLIGVFGKEKVRHYSLNGAENLLIHLPPQCLQWGQELKQPLPRRVELVSRFVEYLEMMEKKGCIPCGIDTRTMIQQRDGALYNWDLQNVLLIREADPQTLHSYRRRCAADLTRLMIQALTGRRSVKVNVLSNLKLTLQGRMFASDQEILLQLLDMYLRKEDCTDLEPLKKALEEVCVSLEVFEPEITGDKQVTLAAASFLHAHPLWKYVRDGQLKILMVGSSPMRKAFLDAVIPCAQMLDTQMHIRIVAEDAAAFCDRYLKKAPLLAQAAQITHIPERPRRRYVLNEQITGRDRQGNAAPLAYLTFEQAAFPQGQESFDAGCILVLDAFTEQMRQALLCAAADRKEPLLIGLKDPVPRPAELQVLGGAVVVDSFSVGRRDDLTKSKMYRDALGIHTYYAKEDEQRKSRQEIIESFDDKYYRDSSIRAALSIPYKLAAYGLYDRWDASRRFREEILPDEDKVRRLIWLEHRSWQAFLILRGWSLDTENLERDFIQNQYCHKKTGVWHACLFGNHDTADVPLSHWSTGDWNRKDIKGLDPLDAMSVTVHRLLAAYVAETVDPEVITILNKLNTRLPAAQWQQLENVVSALRANVTNASVAWKRVQKDLEHCLQQEEIRTLLDRLKALAGIIIKRNACQQYKELDRAILEAIPYLLEKDSVRCIYKLWADREHPWNNLASSFFIEPKHVYLLTTEGHAVTGKHREEFLQFLQDRRKIDTTVTLLPLTELKSVRKGAVLDVTGADTAQLLQAARHLAKIRANLPLIHYKDGRLQALEGDCPLLHCYRCNQSLTVEEVMSVTGTIIHCENETLPMQQLTLADELWSAAQSIPQYNAFSNFLEAFRKQWKVYPRKIFQHNAPWYPHCSKAEADQTGLLALLVNLENARVIELVQWNSPQVTAVNPSCQASLNQMLTAYRNADKPDRRNMNLSFRSDDPEAVCVLERLNLTFHEDLEVITAEKKQYVRFELSRETRRLELNVLTKALDTLENCGLIRKIQNHPLVQVTPNTKDEGKPEKKTMAQICFQYADVPVMDCLTKAGNVLEALAYHTIRQMDVFDDVKLGVSILWREDIAPGTPTQNEIDLVCTKGTRSFFISCKKRPDLKTEQITEIRYETDRFGVNGTPILLTTAPEQSNKAAYVRAMRMGVEVITLKDKEKQNSAQIIKDRIREILKKYT